MYKAILFDLDGTLIDFHACETNALKSALRVVGFQIDSAESWAETWAVYEPISSYFWNRRAEDGLSRNQVVEYSIRDTLVALGEEVSLVPTVAREYWSIFCQTAYPNPGALELLERVSSHYELGLVTNGYGDAQRGRLRANGWQDCFAAVVISDEVGCAKPSREIFDIALSELKVTNRDALYVGDSIEHDYQGAKNAGIDFCYYQPRDEKSSAILHPKFRVRSFEELGRILLDDEARKKVE